MKKTYVFLLTLLGAAIGFNVGMRCQKHFSNYEEHILKMMEQESRADISLRSLKLIHNDSTNTHQFLENELDSAVGLLGGLVDKIPESERKSDDVRMILKAKNYREQFPYTSLPQLEKSVTRAFALAEEFSRNEVSEFNTNTSTNFPGAAPPPDVK